MVTVELAVGFITATLLAAVLVCFVLLGSAHAAAHRTSSEVARQLARGDAVAAEAAKAQSPEGSMISEQLVADGVEVTTVLPVNILGFGSIDVKARSWARYEAAARP